MAETDGNGMSQKQTVAMDMRPPYGVYLDFTQVAEFPTEKEAQALFDSLLGRHEYAIQSAPPDSMRIN